MAFGRVWRLSINERRRVCQRPTEERVCFARASFHRSTAWTFHRHQVSFLELVSALV